MKLFKLFITVFIIITAALFAKDDIEKEILVLEKKAQVLEKMYWEDKQKNLREREVVEEKIKNLSEQIKLEYNKKNSKTEELYLLKENLTKIETKYEDKKNSQIEFRNKISEAIETEADKLKQGFPIMLSRKIPEINNLRDQVKQLDPGSVIENLITYKREKLFASEIIEVGTGEYINENASSGRVEAPFLRVGFIHHSYAKPGFDAVGFLLRETGLKGISYKWSTDVPADRRQDIAGAVDEAMVFKGRDDLLMIPIDPAQSGEKLQSFIKSGSAGFIQAVAGFFKDGGVIMYPMAFILLFGIMIIIDRFIYFNNVSKKKVAYVDDVVNKIKDGNMKEAKEILKSKNNLFKVILLPVIKNYKKLNRDEAERIIDEKMIQAAPNYDKRLPTLAVLAAVAPLLGLLGTVSGMIQLFDVITMYGTSNPKILAGGISVALVTTQAGLGLAIPLTLMHHVLVRSKSAILSNVERVAIDALSALYPDDKES